MLHAPGATSRAQSDAEERVAESDKKDEKNKESGQSESTTTLIHQKPLQNGRQSDSK
jgi:hypothetical protein